MNKVFVLFGLALTANVVFGGPGIVVKFNYGLGIGSDFFYEIPHNKEQVEKKGWIKYDRPTHDRESLELYSAPNDLTVGILLDDNGFAAGFQTAYEISKFTNQIYDWETQGYTYWKVEVNGVQREYWVICQYFCSEEYLQIDPQERRDMHDDSNLLQEDYVWVTGFYGKLYPVPVVGDDIPDAGFTKQSCLPWMGHHYYYNMTKETECSATTILPFFPLVKSNRVIGMGSLTVGNMHFDEGQTNYCESPTQFAVKTIVPSGPECLYELASDPGFTTMHVYYINDPYWITCIFQ